ncbi:MAG: prolipoprotein diacylglyceryl transferase [Patescibacteria group bacterium]|nr:prolipoprotein diacylglyceryl transferase [Patescibacteria group bacterium]
MLYFYYPQIQIGSFVIHTWGFFVALAFLICYWVALREANKRNIKQETILWLVVSIFFGAILGARLGYVLQFPSYYFSNFSEIFEFTSGGLTFHGGLIGALIVGWFYFKKQKKQFNLSFLQLGDMFAPIIALGIFIGRIGCSLINDHQGAITNLPWAIIWPDGILRHPVAEYLFLNALIMFFVLLFLKGKIKKTGYLFIIFLTWYSISRFLLDFTRVSGTCSADPQYFGLFISQWISLLILFGLGILFIKKRH